MERGPGCSFKPLDSMPIHFLAGGGRVTTFVVLPDEAAVGSIAQILGGNATIRLALQHDAAAVDSADHHAGVVEGRRIHALVIRLNLADPASGGGAGDEAILIKAASEGLC
jgi:hypothetical protein